VVIITDPIKRYILAEEKKGFNKSEYDKRIEGYAKRGFRDLTFLLEKAPEHLQARIFTANNLKGLFRALFGTEIKENEPMSYTQRIRMLELCNCALDEIKIHQNGPLLAPNAWKVLKETPSSSYHEAMYGTKVIQAIQIEGEVFKSKERKEKREGDKQ